MPVNGTAVAAAGAGVLLVYSGITGRGVLSTLQNIVQGQSPGGIAPSQLIAGSVAPATDTIAAGAKAVGRGVIAQAALKYQGAGYVWGGNASSIGDWDCSSFVSKVLGQDCGLALPGGHWGDPGFPPHAHGPTTLQYMLFGTGISHDQVEPGDLIVSVEHIGIAISKTQMISAESERTGTGIAGFPAGFPAGPPIYRRVI